jgi:peptidoglycan/xylan/chitin deacetylase (PgdA/CDA1 family)
MSIPASRPVPILTYHSLDTSGSVISVAPDVFEAHMASLADRGFTGIALQTLLDAWDGHGALPERPVVLTFDDGFRNVLEHGVPALTTRGFSGTVFIVTGWCGRTCDWPGQGEGIPRLPLLSWEEIDEVSAAGLELASHTVGHAHLPDLSPDDARREMVDAKAALEDRLGKAVSSFAYPYGDLDPAVTELAREHFRGAVSVRLGTAHPGDDRMLLPRLDVYYLRDPAVFRLLGTARGALYLGARRLARDVKRWVTGQRG